MPLLLYLLTSEKVGAKALGRPESFFSTIISYNKTLTFGGTLEPAFALTVVCFPIDFLPHPSRWKVQTSLDNLNPEANEKYSAIFSEFLKSKLGIPNDRGYMSVFSSSFSLIVI
jgi:phenylpyruvate tautomerase